MMWAARARLPCTRIARIFLAGQYLSIQWVACALALNLMPTSCTLIDFCWEQIVRIVSSEKLYEKALQWLCQIRYAVIYIISECTLSSSSCCIKGIHKLPRSHRLSVYSFGDWKTLCRIGIIYIRFFQNAGILICQSLILEAVYHMRGSLIVTVKEIALSACLPADETTDHLLCPLATLIWLVSCYRLFNKKSPFPGKQTQIPALLITSPAWNACDTSCYAAAIGSRRYCIYSTWGWIESR